MPDAATLPPKRPKRLPLEKPLPQMALIKVFYCLKLEKFTRSANMLLQTIKEQDVFHTHIPARPMGKYAHIVTLRETNSFSLFQTDGELNFARVSVGRD